MLNCFSRGWRCFYVLQDENVFSGILKLLNSNSLIASTGALFQSFKDENGKSFPNA